jgi:O-antigen/teichoic acid export membrane protein
MSGFKARLKWGTLGSLASALVAIYFWSKGNVQFTICFLVIAACLPLMKSTEVYQSFFVGKKFFGQKVRYSVIIQFLASLAVLIAIFWTKDLVVLVSTFFVAYASLQAIFLFMIIKKYSPNHQDDPGVVPYGKHLSLIGVLAIIGQELDKVLLFHYLGPAQVAVYSFATLPVEQVRTPLQNIQDMALPKFSVRDREEIKTSLPKKLLKTTALILVAIVLYIVVVPYFFRIFYPQYLSSVFYSQLYAFNLLVFPISMIMLAIQAKIKTRELYIISTANQIIQISMLLILTPLFGIMGVLATRVFGLIPYFFIAWYYFKKNAASR